MKGEGGWGRKFANAGRGMRIAMLGEGSFYVHLFFATLVILVALMLKVSVTRWCLLVLAITVVLTAEMLNSAIERLARAVTREEHPDIRDALDMASGAVLVATIGAVALGLIALGPLLFSLFFS